MAASRKLFYLIVSNLSSNKLEKNAGEFGVLERWIVDECVKRDDYYPFLRGMIANVTDEIVNVDYVWKRRTAGVSKHNLVLLYDHAINGLVSTGRSFIRPIVVLGLVVGTSSFLFALTNLVLWILCQIVWAFGTADAHRWSIFLIGLTPCGAWTAGRVHLCRARAGTRR